MTDDRARRIREMRNRSSRGGGEDGSDDGTGTDEESASESTAETETADSETEATDGGSSDATAEDGDDAETPEESTDSNVDTNDNEDGDTNDDSSGGETVSYDESEIVDAEDETEADADTEPELDPEAESNPTPAVTDADDADDGLEAMVERPADEEAAEQGIDPALRGAIAGIGGDVDLGNGATVDASAVGQEGDRYGDATLTRSKEVFEQGDSLIASTHNQADTIQMLEFYLRDSRYAIEIDRVSAIVEMKDITRFPRGPDAIDGVTDLRGEITGVLDPTAMLDIERNELSDEHYIVVLERDDDKQKLGVRVTDVSQAVTYRESQIDDPNSAMDGDVGAQHEFVEGIVKKNTDGETTLVTWLDVDEIIDNISTEHTPTAADA
ncbi:chemotaxis protein CheW [Halobiforma lacisalsi AJ5]|uniref:Chemotaxis protein CheW n=1 Tax=Natronobacterium lacisalsi AJ5 TaxID=358396 RepID=M0LZS7_NATLA|nr:chemotaxis protein CheW [Halobiforma lacisalsi]APW97371.1 chemotaxis protein CheW [Halobiforma lacisalsi AJ5]EMA37879.1 chemotaxis protein CheW [Halobiforma lacisalsi AJ5]